ncbi:MAG: hypothetical protein WCK90_04570 [archaeon]
MANYEDNLDRTVDKRMKVIDNKLLEAFAKLKQDIKQIKETAGKTPSSNNKEIEAKLEEISRKIKNLDNQPVRNDNRQSDREKERMSAQLSTLKSQLDEIKKQEEIKKLIGEERKKIERLQVQLDAQKERERILREEVRRKDSQDKKYAKLQDSIANKQSELQNEYSKAMKRMESSFNRTISNIQSASSESIEANKSEKRKLANFYESRIRVLEEERQEQLKEIERKYKIAEAAIQRRNDRIEKEFAQKIRQIQTDNSQSKSDIIRLTGRSENKFIALVKSLEDKRSKEIKLLTSQIYASQEEKKQEQQQLERKIKNLQAELNEEIAKRERRLARQQALADKKAGKVKKGPSKLSLFWAWLSYDDSKPVKKEVKVVKAKTVEAKARKPIKINWLMVLAFAIPIAILLFFLYINFLPFGYANDYTMTVDQSGIVHSSSSRFYLEDAKGNKITNVSALPDGTITTLVINPWVVLKNATVNITADGESVFINSNLKVSDLKVNNKTTFDFSKGIPSSLSVGAGNPTYDATRKCVYFDGNSSLYLANSSDKFETGPFAVYAEWTPQSNLNNSQEIIGHYNWELWQDKNKVTFQIGRVNALNQTLQNLSGKMYTVSYNVNGSFFSQTHSVLAIYNPNGTEGYIAIFIDNSLGEIVSIEDNKIWTDYNSNRPLSLGKSEHGIAEHFTGCVNQVAFYDIASLYETKPVIAKQKVPISEDILGIKRVKTIKASVSQ